MGSQIFSIIWGLSSWDLHMRNLLGTRLLVFAELEVSEASMTAVNTKAGEFLLKEITCVPWWPKNYGYIYIYIFLWFYVLGVSSRRMWVFFSPPGRLCLLDDLNDLMSACSFLPPLLFRSTVLHQARSLSGAHWPEHLSDACLINCKNAGQQICKSICKMQCQIECQYISDRMSEYMSGKMSEYINQRECQTKREIER